eukprot:CAMPEP_0196814348 /NCGR_PEP_ID=MMETSP1362-20130617/42756_1 /TAXON_ID=163516 /ORGANISM="Leptocylindrus danicus, Strain CCMP1856" /LENGTH=357 /DNA_ID=CAMNT_0042190933 /DNA_START=13 /DNA_END=1083 /DNA_ORIENTATION=+
MSRHLLTNSNQPMLQRLHHHPTSINQEAMSIGNQTVNTTNKLASSGYAVAASLDTNVQALRPIHGAAAADNDDIPARGYENSNQIMRRNMLLMKLMNAVSSNPKLASVPNKYGELLIVFVWRLFQSCFDEVETLADISQDGWLGNAWHMIVMLLKIGYHGAVDLPEGTTFRELHAVAGCDCPPELVDFVLDFFPEQAYQEDENGRYALDVAASFISSEHVENELNEYSHEISSRCSARKMRQGKIEMILQANPSVLQNRNGNHPLHIAISSGKQWSKGVESIFRAFPSALSAVDKTTNLYAFQLAAAGHEADLRTTYELLRSMPDLISRPEQKQKSNISTPATDNNIPIMPPVKRRR